MQNKILILGAGQTSMIAAIMLKNRGHDVEIVDDKPIEEINQNHFALLRFKTDKIEKETGIKLQKINTEKAILYKENHYTESNIFFNNLYSKKVSEKYQNRSIGNLQNGTRYQPPEDFFQQLKTRCIAIGVKFTQASISNQLEAIKLFNVSNVISTIPMPTMNKIFFNMDIDFSFQEINTIEFEINDCNLNQTIYFPDEFSIPYRISIIGNKAKCEITQNDFKKWISVKGFEIEHNKGLVNCLLKNIEDAFGISIKNFKSLQNSQFKQQKFGKISKIDEDKRQSIIYNLTNNHNIYSLGRFSCWRNILLDDVVDDVKLIEKLMKLKKFNTSYESGKMIAKNQF
jgi:hypothetical protein